MDKKSILGEIKKLINFTSEEEVKFADAKSGEIIVRVDADDFAPELPLLIVTEEGVIPAEDGDYPLEDGRVLTVVGGLIESIKEAEALEEEEKEVVEELAEEEVKEEVVEEEKLEDDKVEERVTELEKKIEEMESLFTEMLNTTKQAAEFSKSVEDKIENFIKDTPADLEFAEVKSGYQSIKEDKKTTATDNIEAIRNLRTKK